MKRKQFNTYVRKILRHFEISRDLLFTSTKERDVVEARQSLYWACFVHGEFRVGEIVRMMKENGYDIGHSTIIHGINKMKITEDKYNIKLQEKLCTH
jgi:chromosomal replication initiation ATPase DnaA